MKRAGGDYPSDAASVEGRGADELRVRLARLENELFKLRLRRATNQLDNTTQIRLTKREIAVIHTVLSERKAKSGS